MFVKEVVAVGRDGRGNVAALYFKCGTHLCRITKSIAIWDILSGMSRYIVVGPLGQVPLKVVEPSYQFYLRSSPNLTITDNLDYLPTMPPSRYDL